MGPRTRFSIEVAVGVEVSRADVTSRVRAKFAQILKHDAPLIPDGKGRVKLKKVMGKAKQGGQ